MTDESLVPPNAVQAALKQTYGHDKWYSIENNYAAWVGMQRALYAAEPFITERLRSDIAKMQERNLKRALEFGAMHDELERVKALWEAEPDWEAVAARLEHEVGDAINRMDWYHDQQSKAEEELKTVRMQVEATLWEFPKWMADKIRAALNTDQEETDEH